MSYRHLHGDLRRWGAQVTDGYAVIQDLAHYWAKIDRRSMSLATGTRLCNYEIVGPLGAAGMREV